MLALNIAGRSFVGLTHPLAYNQGAPIGFLILEKCCVLLFGVNEYALRLIPLLGGLGSLFLFYSLARRCLRSEGAAAALLLFAVSEPLIYYSSEAKQYSTDVFVCLWIMWAAMRTLPHKKNVPSYTPLAVAGTAGVWISHAAIFVMAGVGGSLMVLHLLVRERQALRALLPTFIFWAASFTLDYLLFLKPLGQNHVLLTYWQNAFAPAPWVTSIGIRHDLHWAVFALWGQFTDPLTVALRRASGLVGLLGVIGLWQDNRRALLFLSPLCVTLLAAAMHKYPFQGRLILFLVPLYQLLIGAGLQAILSQRVGVLAAVRSFISLFLFLFICAGPTRDATYALVHPPGHEELRTVLTYVSRHGQPHDTVYLYYASDPAYKFYTREEGPPIDLHQAQVIHGVMSRDDPSQYLTDLAHLRGSPRVWVVFSHVTVTKFGNEEQIFVGDLNKMGKCLNRISVEGAAAYLYDLCPTEGKDGDVHVSPGGGGKRSRIAPSHLINQGIRL